MGQQAVELAGQVGGRLATLADDHLKAVGLAGVGGLGAEADHEAVGTGLPLGVGGGRRGRQRRQQEGGAEHAGDPQ
jgi:hypothetical protein